jgi:HAD superfamily hydrolase (TIGR01490 family)
MGSEAYRLARDRDVAKERVLVRLLAGMPHDELRDAGRAYARHVEITREMRDRVSWHRGEGHDVVIVSASLELYLSEVARTLTIEHALCTQLETDDDGRCTGRLLGGNCRGPEKATRLRAHLGNGDVVLWAYGDSSGDREMLAMAQHPVRVRRGKLLQH